MKKLPIFIVILLVTLGVCMTAIYSKKKPSNSDFNNFGDTKKPSTGDKPESFKVNRESITNTPERLYVVGRFVETITIKDSKKSKFNILSPEAESGHTLLVEHSKVLPASIFERATIFSFTIKSPNHVRTQQDMYVIDVLGIETVTSFDGKSTKTIYRE